MKTFRTPQPQVMGPDFGVLALASVALALLLVFAVGAAVTGPSANSGVVASGSARPSFAVVLTYGADGTAHLDGQSVAAGELSAELKRRVAARPDLGIDLRMDPQAPIGNMLEIMSVLHSAGVNLVSVGANLTGSP